MVAPAVQSRAANSVDGTTPATGLPRGTLEGHLRVAAAGGNTHTVHDEYIRRHLDPPFEALREALKAAWNDWSREQSHLWRGWNKAQSVTESRERYCMLRTLLNAKHAALFDELADALPPENETVKGDLTAEEATANTLVRHEKLAGASALVNDHSARGIDIDISAERAAIRSAAGL